MFNFVITSFVLGTGVATTLCPNGENWVNHKFDNPGKTTCECYPVNDPCLAAGWQYTSQCELKPACASYGYPGSPSQHFLYQGNTIPNGYTGPRRRAEILAPEITGDSLPGDGAIERLSFEPRRRAGFGALADDAVCIPGVATSWSSSCANCDSCRKGARQCTYPSNGKERCGVKWPKGKLCGLGTTCEKCQETATYWTSKVMTACGKEDCWGAGTTCGLGTTCSKCCRGNAAVERACEWWKLGICKCT